MAARPQTAAQARFLTVAGQPIIKAGELRLRDFSYDDVDLICSASNDALIPLITTVVSGSDEVQARGFVERQLSRFPSGVGFAFAIARADDDLAVGYIGLTYRDKAHDRASIGYWVGPDHRANGHTGAALRALSDWAMANLAITRLELYVEPWNQASIRAAESAGYVREALLEKWELVGDERKDMWMYALVSGR